MLYTKLIFKSLNESKWIWSSFLLAVKIFAGLCPEFKRNQHDSNEKQAVGLREIQYIPFLFFLAFDWFPWESRLVGSLTYSWKADACIFMTW